MVGKQRRNRNCECDGSDCGNASKKYAKNLEQCRFLVNCCNRNVDPPSVVNSNGFRRRAFDPNCCSRRMVDELEQFFGKPCRFDGGIIKHNRQREVFGRFAVHANSGYRRRSKAGDVAGESGESGPFGLRRVPNADVVSEGQTRLICHVQIIVARLTFFRSAARGLHVAGELTREPTKREARKRRPGERPRVGCCEELAGALGQPVLTCFEIRTP